MMSFFVALFCFGFALSALAKNPAVLSWDQILIQITSKI